MLSIRPEAIVVDGGVPGDNRLAARVLDAVYLGEAEQLTLEAGGVRLRATVAERVGRPPLAPGAAVACTIDPRDVVLLPA